MELLSTYKRNYIESIPGYYRDAWENPEDTLKRILSIDDTRLNPDNFDTFVAKGISGMLIIRDIAKAMNKYWAMPRLVPSSHYNSIIIGTLGKRWMFIDDLIDSGKTVKTTIEIVEKYAQLHDFETEFMGALTYNPPEYYSVDELKRNFLKNNL